MKSRKIVFCAATRTEANAIARSTGEEVLLTGVGQILAKKTLRGWFESKKNTQFDPHNCLVVSTGFCGALTEGLSVGDFVTTSSNVNPPFRRAVIVTADEVVLAGTKRADIFLRSAMRNNVHKDSLPICVDMESEALAQVAEEYGADFAVVRMVSDTPTSPLPEFIAVGTKAVMASDMRTKVRLFTLTAYKAFSNPRKLLNLVKTGQEWQSQLGVGVQAWLDSRTKIQET